MDKKKHAFSRLELSKGIKDGKSGIDRDYEDDKYKGVIRGFAVMTKGNVKDYRGWEIDDDTLEQIASAGNKHKIGLKSRFGHPGMSSTALGTFVGRAKNFRVDDGIARADLFLSKTAYSTPDGDLATYVLDLAEKDPEAFGTSVVMGDWELEYRLEKNGTRKKDAEGNELPALLRVKTLMAVDVVDDPAANDGMFHKFFNSSVELSAKATEFLDNLLSNPDALEYVVAFLERFRTNRADIDKGEEQVQVAAVSLIQTELQTSKQQEVEKMDTNLKDVTLDQLKSARPDLVAALQKEGMQEERARALSIVKAGHTEFQGMGMEPIVEEALDKGMTIDAAMSSMRGKRLDDLKKQSNTNAGGDAEQGKVQKTHLELAREYQAKNGGTIANALKATVQAS